MDSKKLIKIPDDNQGSDKAQLHWRTLSKSTYTGYPVFFVFFCMTMDKRQVELAKENKNENIKQILIKIFWRRIQLRHLTFDTLYIHVINTTESDIVVLSLFFPILWVPTRSFDQSNKKAVVVVVVLEKIFGWPTSQDRMWSSEVATITESYLKGICHFLGIFILWTKKVCWLWIS